MYFTTKTIIALAAILSQVSAHGVLTSITGANGVTMNGLSVIDGTPRDCASPGCGSEDDTSVIRKFGSPLGKTKGGGNVDAASAIATFLGSKQRRGLMKRAKATGVKTTKGTVEDGVAKNAGTGATSGLPTADADGIITLTYHQVNQDGAGPLTADIDPSSGGTDASAFKTAAVLQDVPGLGIGGLSGVTTTDFAVKVQMPAGMKCTGVVGGAKNVCIVRVKNSALAGPFGGSAAFTTADSTAAAKRAVGFEA